MSVTTALNCFNSRSESSGVSLAIGMLSILVAEEERGYIIDMIGGAGNV
jgi:hypothetical protein